MSDNNQVVLFDKDDRGVATLTLNRPEKHNAFNVELIEVLHQHLLDIQQDDAIKICVLKAMGKSFSAGADINWMRKMAGYSLHENYEDALRLGQLMHTLYHLGKPTVAMVQGAAFGGGVGLVACCQIAIVDKNAKFCFSETKLGLIPAVISPYIIQAIGARRAKAYFLTAEVFSAKRALQHGLCHEVVGDELEAKCDALLKTLLQNGPKAMKETHNLVDTLQPLTIDQSMVELTAKKIADIRASKEGVEGLTAFLDKRKPNW